MLNAATARCTIPSMLVEGVHPHCRWTDRTPLQTSTMISRAFSAQLNQYPYLVVQAGQWPVDSAIKRLHLCSCILVRKRLYMVAWLSRRKFHRSWLDVYRLTE